MKTILLLLLLSYPCFAADVEFEWSPNQDQVAGYILWEKMPVGLPRKLATVAHPTVTTVARDLTPGRHEVFLTAFSAEGINSDPTDPVVFTVPEKPQGLKIKVVFQTSDNLRDWAPLAVAYVDSGSSRQFIRPYFTP